MPSFLFLQEIASLFFHPPILVVLPEVGFSRADAQILTSDLSWAEFSEQVMSELYEWLHSLPESKDLTEEMTTTKRRELAKLTGGWITSKLMGALSERKIVIRGKSPARATAIYVNDYKLQLFTPAKGEWSYVASLKLKNMIPGSNTYDVVAEDAQGRRSEAARLTIV
jgi:hypothetical protein